MNKDHLVELFRQCVSLDLKRAKSFPPSLVTALAPYFKNFSFLSLSLKLFNELSTSSQKRLFHALLHLEDDPLRQALLTHFPPLSSKRLLSLFSSFLISSKSSLFHATLSYLKKQPSKKSASLLIAILPKLPPSHIPFCIRSLCDEPAVPLQHLKLSPFLDSSDFETYQAICHYFVKHEIGRAHV